MKLTETRNQITQGYLLQSLAGAESDDDYDLSLEVSNDFWCPQCPCPANEVKENDFKGHHKIIFEFVIAILNQINKSIHK